MSDHGPVLHTARLLLRPTRAEDFDAWAAFCADEECMRYLGGVQSRAMSWRSIATMAGSWHLYGYSMFSVIERATGRWIGRLGPWQPAEWPGTEIGWGLSREAWGKGYAIEGVTAVIDWAFDHLGWTEVIHAIDPANVRSQAVARRIGSRLRGPGTLPAPFDRAPIELWGQSRDEWRARAHGDSHADRVV